jgi:hypothetical protein
LAILTPDEKLSIVYDLEKKKEDEPQTLNLTETSQLTDTPEEEQMQFFQKMNIQLQLPPEASEQFLEMLGIEFEDMDDTEDDLEDEDGADMDDEIDMEDDVNWETSKPKPKKSKPTPSKKDKGLTFGNSPDDWSPDPADYLK